MARFPWPNPPEPSVSMSIPPEHFFGRDSEGKTLMDVARRLSGSILEAGYREVKYLGAGCKGFAIALDLEHIKVDGTRQAGAAGFARPGQESGFSLTDYLARLFYAPPGYYRQIVFVVSDERMVDMATPPSASQLRAIRKNGSPALPPSFARLPYTWRHDVLALIYEFEKGPRNGEAKVIPPPSRLSAPVHLDKAGVP